MSRDIKKTPTLSFEARLASNSTGEQSGSGYDRADLARTPLAKLIGLSGIVIGQKNLLEGFGDQIKYALKDLDEDYRIKSDRLERYTFIVGDGATGRAAEFRDAARVDLANTKVEITNLLTEKFKGVFEFLIDSLGDEQLEKLNLGVSQKKIATILYDHLDYYENAYALGKIATVLVIKFAIQKAQEKGESIVRNVERDELDIRMLQQEISEATKDPSREVFGTGLLGGPRKVVSQFKETLPPPPFKPDSKLPPPKAPEGFLPPTPSQSRKQPAVLPNTPPPTTFEPDSNLPISTTASAARASGTNERLAERYITGKTIPFQPGAIVPGSYEHSVLKEAEEDMEGLNLRASKVPDLSSLDAEVLTGEEAARIVSESEAEERLELERSLPSILEDETDSLDTINSPMPSAASVTSRSFSSGEMPGMVAGRPVSYSSAEPVLPPRPRIVEVKKEATIVVEIDSHIETENRAQLESAPVKPVTVTGGLMKIDQPIEEDEKTIIADRTQLLPPTKESWWNSTKEKVSGWYGNAKTSVSKFYTETKNSVVSWYKSAKDWALPKARRVVRPLVVVAGLAAFSAIGVTDFNGSVQKKDESAESAKTPAASTIASAAPSASETAPDAKRSGNVDLTQAPEQAQAPTAIEAAPKFADVLLHSKSPLVQQIIKDGKLTLGSSSITDAMIGSMRGLTTNAQSQQVVELEKQINLGLGVYFNEHFGTPAKVAESMKDPNLRNLYRTAKYAQEKGWFASYHTKERFPQAYLLALEMLGDSHELGHDVSDNPSAKVKAFAQGNMFQAKLPGNTINLKKANGHYHVITEYMMGILDGKNVRDMMKTEFAAVSAKEAAAVNNAPAGVNNVPVVGQPVHAPQVDVKNNGQQGTILPTIIGNRGILDLAGYGDSVERGWDALIERADQMNLDKAAFERTGIVEFDLPLSMTTRQENEAILPTLIEKVIALNPQADETAIRKLIKRYGFIGVKSWGRTKPGHFKVELHPNFLKILKPELKSLRSNV